MWCSNTLDSVGKITELDYKVIEMYIMPIRIITYLVILQKLFQLPAVVDFIFSCLNGFKGVEDVESPDIKLMLEKEEL